MPTRADFRDYFKAARKWYKHPGFQRNEVLYKVAFQGELQDAMVAYQRGAAKAPALLKAALASPNQNTIDWRVLDPFHRWCRRDRRRSSRALRQLWFGSSKPEKRLAGFARAMDRAGMSQPGAQLSVGSTLLMGVSARRHPPVRTTPFNRVFSRLGRPPFPRSMDAGSRYLEALRFLDELVRHGKSLGVPFRHRLDAPGTVWCLRDGWNRKPAFRDSGVMADDPEWDNVAGRQTQRQALDQARIGQDRFRSQLIGEWGKCAVTGLRNPTLLRASHIKPWKASNNQERLDRFNGLLLAPHIDAAFDRGLISFDDQGRISISSALSAADRKAMGIHRGLRLSHVRSEHRRYLAYHRRRMVG